VHDAGPRHRRQLRIQRQQAILQGAAAITGARVNHQPGRLVYDQHMPVAMHHLEGHALGFHAIIGNQSRMHDHLFATENRIAGPRRAAIHLHVPGLDPCRQPRARVLRQRLAERQIQPRATRLRRQFQPVLLDLGSRFGRRGAFSHSSILVGCP
jgi:hypothetical protein